MFVVASSLLAIFLFDIVRMEGISKAPGLRYPFTPHLDFPAFLLAAFTFRYVTWPVSRQPDYVAIHSP